MEKIVLNEKLTAYTDQELKEEIEKRELLLKQKKYSFWADLVLEACSSGTITGSPKGTVLYSSEHGCRVTWPITEETSQYMLPNGTEVRKLVKEIAKADGFFWLGREKDKIYFEVLARGPL